MEKDISEAKEKDLKKEKEETGRGKRWRRKKTERGKGKMSSGLNTNSFLSHRASGRSIT